jgi:pimeloyl-ACP methyl ester carboxylesterase
VDSVVVVSEYAEVITRDGRSLEVLLGGDPDGFPCLFHLGSPDGATPYDFLDEVFAAAGLRMITYSRPGYGGSTRRVREAPRFVDDVDDVQDLLAAYDVSDFVTIGWSGGGPRALATAALVPGCRAVATLAGVGPRDLIGESWFEGMAPENVAEYTAAAESREAYAAHTEREFLPVLQASPDQLAEAMGGLFPPVDVAVMDPAYSAWLASGLHAAGAQGIDGVVDDGLAAVAPWGFSLNRITVPVAVYQGRLDAMVPFHHGEWLAAHVPGAAAHLTETDGHMTWIPQLPAILARLTQEAGI